MSKAKTVSSKREWKLFDGVGFAPDAPSEFRDRGPAIHFVVLMQSMHSGTDVYGPFVTEDAAHKWIREDGEGELFQRFDRAAVPGVSFHVEWLMVPNTRRGE